MLVHKHQIIIKWLAGIFIKKKLFSVVAEPEPEPEGFRVEPNPREPQNRRRHRNWRYDKKDCGPDLSQDNGEFL